jgi:hypothetical protein
MSTEAAQFAAANPAADDAQRAVRRASIFAAAGPNKPFLTVLPLNTQSAIIFGAYRMTVMTNDGGKDWTDWSLHVGDPVSHGIFDAIQLGTSIYLAGETGVVLRSDDQGQSFIMQTIPDQSTLFGDAESYALVFWGCRGSVPFNRSGKNLVTSQRLGQRRFNQRYCPAIGRYSDRQRGWRRVREQG